MRIGIDIDDTITNTTFDIDACASLYDKNLTINKEAYYFEERYKWPYEKCEEFWHKYVDKIMSNTSVKEDASLYINKLYEEGNTIYIITARNNKYSTNVIDITKSYLDKHGIKYHYLITDSNNKGSVCIENKIDIMVDDSPYQAYDLDEFGIKYVLFNNDYNKNIDCKHVDSWEEVYKYINRR